MTDSRNNNVIYRIITGLILTGFTVAVVLFIGYPLLSEYKGSFLELKQLSPYNLGYHSGVLLMIRLSPPNYNVSEIIESDAGDDTLGNGNESMEYISDSQEVSLADLEAKNTVLKVSSVSIEGKVVDGISQESMLKGFWHYPLSSEPGKRGNTVIFGHRFDKLPPSTDTFFYLDKIKVGDKIEIIQTDGDFSYTVVETKIVEKSNSEVLDNSSDYRITLVTCTPLWTSEKRLVVVAIQDKVGSVI
ncbi:sortase [Candidatus Dojkabacteria bacterium]|nr:sortase [Candidatus Dojkabacteria bacterium]